jgi:hypothetical protein
MWAMRPARRSTVRPSRLRPEPMSWSRSAAERGVVEELDERREAGDVVVT